MLLSRATRDHYRSLLDARALTDAASDEPAIVYLETDAEPHIVTRKVFRVAVRLYAAAFQSMGLGAGDLVVIAHTQNLDSIYAFWGALTIGAIPSMFPTLTEKLDPDIYIASMAELVRLSEVKAILTTEAFAPILREHVACPVHATDTLMESLSSARRTFRTFSPMRDETAFLQHSSGTTGLQKGVMLTHGAVLNHLASYSDSLMLSENDVIVSWLPLYHDMGLIAGFLLPLVQGVPLVLMSPFDWVKRPAMLLKAIHDYKGTLTWLPNFAYNHCARRIRQRDSEGLDLSSMRAFINCSEPVRQASHQQFLERFAAHGVTENMLSVSYAMAENTFAVTQTPMGAAPHLDVIDRDALREERRAVPIDADAPNAEVQVSCGPPIAGVAVKVVADDGTPLPERHVGELMVQSDSMLVGYYKRPDLQPIVDGWYKTGDMGYVAQGEVYIIGRSKDLIINAGKNVYPQDIEAIVNTVDGVHKGRAVVFGVWDDREGTELLCVVAEIDDFSEAAQKRIGKEIREAVARQSEVTISFVRLVDSQWLIKTSSGKIARAANRDKWLAERKGARG